MKRSTIEKIISIFDGGSLCNEVFKHKKECIGQCTICQREYLESLEPVEEDKEDGK